MAGAGKTRQKKERQGGNGGNHGNNSTGTSPKNDESAPSSSSPSNPPTSAQGPYDGNRDPVRRGSNAAASGRPSDITGVSPAQNPSRMVVANKNLDLGLQASYRMQGYASKGLPKRVSLNQTGRACQIKLNTFNVLSHPTNPVFQYDVQIGTGSEKRGLIRKCWQSRAVQQKLGPYWIFDGNRIAFWVKRLEENPTLIDVDMNVEDGRPERWDPQTQKNKPHEIHKVVIRNPKKLNFNVLEAWLAKTADFDDTCLESLNFLDHLMRELPSQQYTQIKRMFFKRGDRRTLLEGGIEAFKGVYATVRPTNRGLNAAAGLSVNVDVANGTFWSAINVLDTVRLLLNARDVNDAYQKCRIINGKPQRQADPLKRLRKLRINTRHRENHRDIYTIAAISNETSRTQKMPYRNSPDGPEQMITVEQYFFMKYGKRLQMPEMPLLQMTKKNISIPFEMCFLEDNQRYLYKLSERQTANMIRFAVTLPNERWGAIEHGLRMLNWDQDQYLREYGMHISNQPETVTARLLPTPNVQFKNDSVSTVMGPYKQPSGRWNLQGKQFLQPYKEPIGCWGVVIVDKTARGQVTKPQMENFVRIFVDIMTRHGCQFTAKTPYVLPAGLDVEKFCLDAFNQTGNHFNKFPQLLVFIVPYKDSNLYNRIKKCMDCRHGVPSQVLQSAHVIKAQAQYCSNVAMKVNAKLGGITAKAIGMKGRGQEWITDSTMIIGADVSHGAPNTDTASIAAITVSWDRAAIRYCAAVQANGSRVEMISPENWQKMFKPLARKWIENISGGKFPDTVYYFRDGVSEGQYAHVVEQEAASIRRVLMSLSPNAKDRVKMTVLVCSKRHHVRFFPVDAKDGDKNFNPLPGTLVETKCTHPTENDYYLNAHSAIKGTSRPVHYHTLMDEQNLKPEQIQNMIYEASYQYVRSTTPVSLFPAIYYAHLAAARGICHVPMPGEAGAGQNAPGQPPQDPQGSASSPQKPDIESLVPMSTDTRSKVRTTMWFV
ncbi:MAG: hypothetical protein M1828_003743 [Chrysothrix sp. TS-e1954]|nr:MAG: hypothetical protein M1828_003743 [Chrysothrix sp. TS-e1954]